MQRRQSRVDSFQSFPAASQKGTTVGWLRYRRIRAARDIGKPKKRWFSYRVDTQELVFRKSASSHNNAAGSPILVRDIIDVERGLSEESEDRFDLCGDAVATLRAEPTYDCVFTVVTGRRGPFILEAYTCDEAESWVDGLRCLIPGNAVPNVLADVEGALKPFHSAALHGDIKHLEHLLLCGADIWAVDSRGRGAAHFAAAAGQHSVLRFFCDFAVELLAYSDRMGNTPLHVAVSQGEKKCVEALLESAASPCVSNIAGWSPLRLAAQGHRELEHILSQYKDNTTGLILDLNSRREESATDMDRIMQVWNRFFENAIMMGESAEVKDGVDAELFTPGAAAMGPSDEVEVYDEDWDMCWDDDAQKWYWWNYKTNECQWAYSADKESEAKGVVWSVHVDDHTHMPYWYNCDTGEAQWVEESNDIVALNKFDEEWELCFDADSNCYYWHNLKTKESTWVQVEAAIEDEPAAPFQEYFDKASGQCYMYNAETGQSEWMEYLDKEEEENWDLLYDDDYELYYWYNNFTRESKWADDESDSTAIINAVVSYDSGSSSEWMLCHDDASGADYWHNTHTHESQWVKEEESTAAVSYDAQVNSEWVLCHDDDTGADYWFNDATKESQWVDYGTMESPSTSTALAIPDIRSSWKRCYDEAYAAYYLHDETTGESVWEV